jgi:hypothetical protein
MSSSTVLSRLSFTRASYYRGMAAPVLDTYFADETAQLVTEHGHPGRGVVEGLWPFVIRDRTVKSPEKVYAQSSG